MMASAYTPTMLAIDRTVREIDGVVTFTLTPPGGFRFAPGQFNMLYVHGVGEVAISISGDPAEPAHLVHTVRSVGTVTRAMAALGLGSASCTAASGSRATCCTW
jgi:NAD(P)H-flavin reductase